MSSWVKLPKSVIWLARCEHIFTSGQELLKPKLSAAIAIILLSFSLGAGTASAGSTETDSGTAIYKATYEGYARYALLGNGLHNSIGCKGLFSSLDESRINNSAGWQAYEFQAFCAIDSEFCTELCKAETTLMIIGDDLKAPAGSDSTWQTECIDRTYCYGGGLRNLVQDECWTKYSDVMS